ncbi:MAG: hypothetical protein WC764_02270 [Candidatus Paceibacterota bacterium]|jgi:bifunctional DNA-binding transcriptional regulator/antitoxin component of YhaV-PrlF toxin-antitoxin module
MKTFEKIVYASEKGQITLPVAWRSQTGTNMFRIKAHTPGNLEVVPVQDQEDEETGWVTVFNKDRDNNGKGLPASEFIRVLRKIRKEEDGRKSKRKK